MIASKSNSNRQTVRKNTKYRKIRSLRENLNVWRTLPIVLSLERWAVQRSCRSRKMWQISHFPRIVVTAKIWPELPYRPTPNGHHIHDCIAVKFIHHLMHCIHHLDADFSPSKLNGPFSAVSKPILGRVRSNTRWITFDEIYRDLHIPFSYRDLNFRNTL